MSITPLRFGFVTCVELGLSCMEEIDLLGGRLAAALTLPDDRARGKAGRVYLDEYCSVRGIPLFKAANINEPAAVKWLHQQSLDWLFIIGWSQVAGVTVLNSVARGVIGMHPTLLPEGRGRAAIPWAILKNLPKTGVSMFQLDEGVDTGPVLARREIPLSDRETATMLYAKVASAHRELMRATWPKLLEGTVCPMVQDESRASVWPGRNESDGRLDPAMRVADADRLIRAVARPYPGAFLDFDTHRLRIWAAVMADQAVPGADGILVRFADGALLAVEYAREPRLG